MKPVNNIILNVRGMNCGSCVGRIRRALQEVAGIEATTIDLASGTVSVSGSSIDKTELVQAIANAGYAASLQEAAGTAA